jgi:Polyketide cyclase / dehydrase and lipid transport
VTEDECGARLVGGMEVGVGLTVRSVHCERRHPGDACSFAGYALAVRRIVALVGPLAGVAGGYLLVVRGALTLDLGWGRRVRPLGPIDLTIAAPPETVFDVIAEPYLGRTPRAIQHKLRVLERGSDMALASHFTSTGRITTTTVETVRFERPHRISFRLVRGPVPYVVETYELRKVGEGTEFVYSGELGTDLWRLGQWWGDRVAGPWEHTVARSLDDIRAEAERRAAHRRPAVSPEATAPTGPGRGRGAQPG